MNSLINQLIREARSSGPKTAILAILFLVGLFFWIPPLYRTVVGRGATRVPPVHSTVNSQLPPVVTVTSFSNPPEQPNETAMATYSWENAAEIMATDPLVQSVEVAAILGDPFRVDDPHLSPITSQSDQQNNGSNLQIDSQRPGPKSSRNGLTLKSTIVGVKRRAAYINRRLYFEGAKIEADGKTYILTAVYPRKVVLTRGHDIIELIIPDQLSAENVRKQQYDKTSRN